MRTALITGAAGGMGAAISSALIEQGYQVVLVDRDQAAVTALAQSLGDKATGWVLDITNGAMVDQ
jgi:3-hydroxy acid dehydrogenase/malonic semialdehyde reductase